jgi:hypothetical protein
VTAELLREDARVEEPALSWVDGGVRELKILK